MVLWAKAEGLKSVANNTCVVGLNSSCEILILSNRPTISNVIVRVLAAVRMTREDGKKAAFDFTGLGRGSRSLAKFVPQSFR
jgi:hypothetical protein